MSKKLFIILALFLTACEYEEGTTEPEPVQNNNIHPGKDGGDNSCDRPSTCPPGQYPRKNSQSYSYNDENSEEGGEDILKQLIQDAQENLEEQE